MAIVIAVMNQKGGAGKTTVAQHLSAVWQAQGKNVLLIDADEQGNAISWFHLRKQNSNLSLSHYGPVLRRRYEMDDEWHGQTIAEKTPETVACLGGVELLDLVRAEREHRDIIVIDCPPRLGEEQQSAMLAADTVVLPIVPGQNSIDSSVKATRTIALWCQHLRSHGLESLPSFLFLMNMVRKPSAVKHRLAVRKMAEALRATGQTAVHAAVELSDRKDDLDACSGDGSLIIDESKLSELTAQFFQLASEVLENAQERNQRLPDRRTGQSSRTHDAA